MSNVADLAARSLTDDTHVVFEDRIVEQADFLRTQLTDGSIDSATFAVGFELECYAVDDACRLTAMPATVLEGPAEKELGVHNAEFNTAPVALTEQGLKAQRSSLAEVYEQAQEAASAAGSTVVLDAMWTIPPPSGSTSYLSDVSMEGELTVAKHMTPSARYVAIDNDIIETAGGSVTIDVPGARVSFPSILVESLTSSIQPHVQVPSADAYVTYHNLALRTLGPVLSLATNAPLLPHDLYEDRSDPETILDETYHELRIPVFEQSINGAWNKVRFPVDLAETTSVIEELEADPTCAPFLREWITEGSDRTSFRDRIWEIDHKRGTYWRWLRAVIGGQPVGDGDERSIRIEYRPIPTQPTVDENIAFQALVAGLVTGLVATDHPVGDLPHEAAKRSFYRAVRDGPEAHLRWITIDGVPTEDRSTIIEDVFDVAREGLRVHEVSPGTIDDLLDPIERRHEAGCTPSQWKLERVRAYLTDGLAFDAAVTHMQRDYVSKARTGRPVVEW